MLRIIGSHCDDPYGYLAVATHDHPLDFIAYRKILPQPYYWLVGSSADSRFMLTIERSIGVVREADLVLPGSHVLTSIPSGYRTADRKTGLPVVDTSEFDEYDDVEEDRDFHLVHEGSTRYIIFDPSLNPTLSMGIDRVAFFAAGELLCGVGFFDLTANEIEALEACLRSDHS